MGYQDETLISNRVAVHPQLSQNSFPMDGALVGAKSPNPKGSQSYWVVTGKAKAGICIIMNSRRSDPNGKWVRIEWVTSLGICIWDR